RFSRDWSSDVCSSDLVVQTVVLLAEPVEEVLRLRCGGHDPRPQQRVLGLVVMTQVRHDEVPQLREPAGVRRGAVDGVDEQVRGRSEERRVGRAWGGWW